MDVESASPTPSDDHSPPHSTSLFNPLQPCRLLIIPPELRNKIYRYFVISHLDCQSHPRLWRPLGVDGGILRIGYFNRDTVIPLLLTCRQIHEEAAATLYGENTFAFHISGLSDGPIAFLEWLAPRYVRLLRRVYIRTGYSVDTYGFRPESPLHGRSHAEPTLEQQQIKASRDLAVSVALMKQAWPPQYKVFINKELTIVHSSSVDRGIVKKQKGNDWPASSYHLWKMFVTDDSAENPRHEFRRIEWTKRK